MWKSLKSITLKRKCKLQKDGIDDNINIKFIIEKLVLTFLMNVNIRT